MFYASIVFGCKSHLLGISLWIPWTLHCENANRILKWFTTRNTKLIYWCIMDILDYIVYVLTIMKMYCIILSMYHCTPNFHLGYFYQYPLISCIYSWLLKSLWIWVEQTAKASVAKLFSAQKNYFTNFSLFTNYTKIHYLKGEMTFFTRIQKYSFWSIGSN